MNGALFVSGRMLVMLVACRLMATALFGVLSLGILSLPRQSEDAANDNVCNQEQGCSEKQVRDVFHEILRSSDSIASAD
jgi:hypothetical protein